MGLGSAAFMLLIIGTVRSQGPPRPELYSDGPLTCPDDSGGTYLGGDKCYWVFRGDQKRTWYHASQVCESYGMHLVVLKDQEESDKVGRLVDPNPNTQNQPYEEFWVGVHCPDENCATGAIDSYGNEVSHNQASWGDGEPAFEDGTCFFTSKNEEHYAYDKPYVQSACGCSIKRAFVCEKPAVPQNSFMCFNRGFTDAGNVCNGRQDCVDGSDEINCGSTNPNLCHYHYKAESGQFSLPQSTPGNRQTNYENSTTCTWAIETPIGTNAFINFTRFDTEREADIVQVYVGSIIEINADPVASLSGQLNTNTRDYEYRSHNNMMFIKFSSDSYSTATGFSVVFGSVELPHEVTRLIAGYTPNVHAAPLYDVGGVHSFLGMADYEFLIEASTPYQIVTVEIEELLLGDMDKIEFYDGESPRDKKLLTVCKTCPDYNVISSTGKYMLIQLSTNQPVESRFVFRYKQGCDVTLTSNYGMLFSPGYVGRINYPNNVMCTWTINANEPITIYFESDLQLVDDHKCIQDSNDFLQIYRGLDARGSALHSGRGFRTAELAGQTFQSDSNGQIHISFKTSPTANERGFMVKWSKDCVNPMYDSYTLIDNGNTPVAPYHFRASMTLTCALGYGFHQQQFAPLSSPTQSVTFTCGYKGEWNYRYIPRCTANYCGDVPRISNGYIAFSTGSVYGGLAGYECYPGSEPISQVGPQNNKNITCQPNSAWQTPPTCQAAACNIGLINLNIANGAGRIRANTGDGSSIGSIIDYECDAGFQIDGDPILICENDGRWSASNPFCRRKTCLLPSIANGIVSGNLFLIDFNTVASVTCDSGYTFEDPLITSMRCMADRNVNQIPRCVDEDECSRQFPPCEHQCRNLEGSYLCTCNPGYEPVVGNPDRCTDINQCTTGNHACDGGCSNTAGGYTCSCTLPYVLYTTNGLSGYFIPPSEDGLNDLDTYRLNKSCVLKACDPPLNVNNARLLTLRQYHRYGDIIEYRCDQGYRPQFASSLIRECDINGDWTGALPVCVPALCPEDYNSFPSPQNPASYSSGPYNYDTTLYLNCTRGSQSFTQSRQCVYNRYTGVYELQGSSYECGVINCGQPERVAGSVYTVLNTIYPTSFEFACSSGNQPSGSSTSQGIDRTVQCGEDGHWMFGSLQCYSQACPDPGYPAGGRMIATSLADQSVVTFECTKLGYTLSHNRPLTCIGTNWNDVVPSCIDTTRPSIQLNNGQPCDGTYTIRISKYESIDLRDIAVSYSDNDRIMSFVVEPRNVNTTLKVDNDLTVRYTATDYSLNQAICEIQFRIIDEEPPTIQCPPQSSLTVYVDDENNTPTLEIREDMFTVNDNFGAFNLQPIQISPPPPTTFSFADLYQTYLFRASVSDQNNNVATCQAQVFVTRRSCTPNSFPTPLNAAKVCTPFGAFGGWSCTITCDARYTFENDGGNGKQRTVTCQSGGNWDTAFISACVQDRTYPIVTCPTSSAIYFSSLDDSQFVDYASLPYSATDLNTLTQRTFSPETSHNFTGADLYQTREITMFVEDNAGLVSSCKFQYIVLPRIGSPMAYPDILYGSKSCSRTFNPLGYQCTITCNPGYVLRDYGISTVVNSVEGFDWDEIIPACVPDTIRPLVSCPRSKTLRLQHDADNATIQFGVNDFNDFSSSDAGGIATSTFSPAAYTFTTANLYTAVPITLTVVDYNNNAASCSFSVRTMPAVCSELSLPNPANGRRDCVETFSGWQCTLTCNTGYSFSHTTNVQQTISCTDGVGWLGQVPGCSLDSDTIPTVYFAEVEYRYQPVTGVLNVSTDCLSFYQNQQSRDFQTQSGTVSLYEAMADKMEQGCYSYADVPFNVAIDITFLPQYFQTTLANIGTNFVPQFRQIVIVYTFTMTISDSSQSENCKNWFFDNMARTPNSFEFAKNIPGNAGTCPELRWDNTMEVLSNGSRCLGNRYISLFDPGLCRRCPAGSVSDSVTCSVCPLGQYHGGNDDIICSTCPVGSTTRYPGATSINDCIIPCRPGQFSDDGFEPCSSAPVGYYTSDGVNLNNCPSGLTTTTVGSSTVDACITPGVQAEPCGAGTQFDGSICQLCGLGFYRPVLQSSCQQCPLTGTTTYIRGAISDSSCYGGCGGGLTSADGLAPCTACPRGSYYVNSTYCQSCAQGLSTRFVGATGPQECISVSLLRVNCPRGKYRDATTGLCQPCAVGTYADNEEVSQCTSCPAGSSTYHAGSTSRAMCFTMCRSGTTSTTGLSPCTPCGFGSYALNPTTCATCPAGTMTKTNYASTQAECIPECGLGSFSVTGYNFDNTCRLCPANFYQDQTGQTTCKQCGPAQYTAIGQTGATSSSNCLDTAFQTLCAGRCNQGIGGVCSIEDHAYSCTCPAGYYGADCEFVVNYCENNPCFNNGQCQSAHDGPICNCGNFAYGDYCENVNVTCTPDYCDNGGYCLNKPGYQECLCTEGYSDARCSQQQSICPINPANNPCQNGGVCEDTSFGKNLRRKCNCREGWTGASCEIMIDLCESTPCLYGAQCVPQLNDYRCECPSQYSGKNCQLRQDRCQGYDCNGGQCVDDYMADEPRCLCAPGFIYGSVEQYNIQLDTAYSPLPANPELSGVTAQDCRDRCYQDSTCNSFSFNVGQGNCYIWRDIRGVTLSQSFGYNHYTKETIAQATDDYWTEWYDVSRPTNSNGNDDRELRADLINTYGINVCEGSEPISVECRDVATQNPVSSLSGATCDIDGLLCDGFGPCLNYEVRYKCAVHRAFKNNRCERLDACIPNPCPLASRQATGCRTVNDNYECICADGYTGRSCQINIDDCERLQCQNGGICIDRLGGIDCDCTNAIGYTGTLCELGLDYCAGNTCSGHGRCENTQTNYICVCNVGWEGRNCETLTDTCRGNPCLHGGICVQPVNTVNVYQCQCATGWTGTNCEQIIDYCAIGGQRTCRAQCYSIFGNYYCKCPANVYGPDCENTPNPCGNYNKCLTQNGGVCSYDTNMAQMTCSCTDPRYTGDGCHILVDHCSANSNNCLNGGTCHIQPSGYTCECLPGYTGRNCETQIDECLGITCPGGGDCFSDIGRYYCRCPLKKTGANCLRDYDPDYDICFNHPQGLSYAWVPFPNQVINGDRMTVTLWVRFFEPGSTGTFFNMFIGDTIETSFKFMDFHHDGVRIYISTDGGITPYTFLPFSFTHAVTDGNWHSIVLNYNLAEGRIALIKNSIKMTLPDFVSPALVIDDRTFKFWSVIGCEFNQATKSCMAGNIFHGCVSQVNFYDRNLDFNFEIHDLLTEPRKVYDPFFNVLLVWNEYLRESGSGRIIPSEANRLPCPSRCRTYSALSRPRISSSKPCPRDQVIYSTDRLTSVTWDEPAFEGADNLVRPEYQSGASYHWGTYQITYIAEAASGEKAFCSFKLYVQSGQCDTPPRPLGGNEPTCETDPDGYRGCTLSCYPNSLIDRVTPQRFTCDRTGSWNVEKRFNRFMFPPCGDVSSTAPRDSLFMAVSYEIGTIACRDAEIDFKARTRQAFADLNIRMAGVNELCGVSDCSDLTINVLCGQTGLQDQVVAILEVTIPDCIHRTTVDGISMLTSELITCSVIGPARILNFNDTIPLASIEDPTYSITPTRVCPTGRVLINDLCVECGAGTYWYKPSVNAPAYCESCRRGEYQGQTGQMSCESCGNGLTTEMMGSTGFDMCRPICGRGQYFDLDAINPGCRDCPVGFYQDEEGQFFCKFCLRGYTTKAAGSITVAACQVTCQSGEELSDTGCVKCAIGYYRDETQSRTCQPCPAGKITLDLGATSIAQCVVEACEAGRRLNVNTNTCELCPIGYYQDEKWQTSCKSCGDQNNWRTDSLGSADPQDCRYYCPEGYEAHDVTSPNPYCKICDIGFYKNNLVSYYSQCSPCPGNYRTKFQGSISAQNCTIYKCPAGQQPNAGNNGCEECGLGYYQPLEYQEQCLECPGILSTRTTGSTSQASCENYCDPGEEKQASGRCVQCLQGFYKDNDLGLFSMCMACPENYTTLSVGASKAIQCSIRDCRAGYRRDIGDTGCIPCGQGTYQPEPYKDNCISCPPNQSTRTIAATSPNQCEVFCNPGQQKTDLGCEPCARGYYKTNDVDVFSMCMMCPIDRITPTIGSDEEADCFQENCTAGYRLDTTTNRCVICPKGSYQEFMWKTTCDDCGQDRTTENVGATHPDLCILSCAPGREDIGGVCRPCPRGTYKTQFLAAACTACPQGFTTESTGADTPALCTLPACAAGYYLDRSATPIDCKRCGYNQYQDEVWQESCKSCPGSLVTLWTARTTLSDCITDCASGSEYNFNTQVCDICARGYYRDRVDKLQYDCQLCDLNFITNGTGATSVAACNIRNCTQAGYYLNVPSNQCLQCPRGTYLNQRWQTRCTDCPSDYSTLDVGSTSINDCRRTCPLGQYVTSNNLCRDCDIGSYRDASSGENCVLCPDGLLTPTTGATSDAQCTLSPCVEGEYYIRGQLRCAKCARGTYQDQKNTFQCIACPYAIKYTPQIGATSLALCASPCTFGQQMNPVTLTCEACPVGYYQESDKQFVCTECPAGRKFTVGTGSTRFSDCKDICEAGNDCSVNANCISDAAGYTCQCFENYVDVNNNGRNCQACTAGQYYTANQCRTCPSGQYQPSPGMDSCLPCAGGTISTDGRIVCAQCEAGTYSNSGSSVCLACPAGQYQPNTGEASCRTCPDGTEVNNDRTACSQCPAGTYSTGTIGDCRACPVGQYQPNTGQGACLTCSQGTEVNNARTLCLPCQPGRYSVVAANGCQLCPAGQYQPASGQSTCLSCVDSSSNDDRTRCINLCDLGYCLNGGTCDVGPLVKCTCSEWYTGNKCQIRKNSENVADRNIDNVVIPVAISIAALLLIIIAIAVACFVCLRKTPSKAVQYTEFAGERNDKVSVHSYGNTPYNFQGNKMMLQPFSEVVMENPAYTGSAVGGDPAVYTA